ncbi:RCC1 and BTB domain-containing protein 1-like isoform X2 [Planococcus citri]|uniref:RCC1 and BTB domain-containing protein 1-like isoform X2 n=1 Tax=Planococcus citri TaxID=170843 RepID=UPI0031F99A29
MVIRRYLCDWELSDDFLEQIQAFEVWSNDYELGNAIFVMKNQNVYAAGGIIECCGRVLSSENFDVKERFYEPVNISELCGKQIKKCILGISQVFICTEEGKVFGYGSSDADVAPYFVPQEVVELRGLFVVDIAIGPAGRNLAVCDDGKIYLFEFGEKSKYLINSCSSESAKPLNVFYMTTGEYYISLLENGTVAKAIINDIDFSASDYNDSRDENGCEVKTFHLTDLEGIKKMVCGSSHALALDELGRLFVIGSNQEGELGLDTPEVPRESRFVLNSSFEEKIVDIAASRFCSLSAVLTESGKVYMWGKGRGAPMFKPKLTPFYSLHKAFFHYANPLVTYKSMNVNEISPTISEPMKKFELPDFEFESPGPVKSCDVCIEVGSRIILTHTSVLSSRCEYFAKLFQEDRLCHECEKKIKLKRYRVLEATENYNFNVMKAFLKYLYTDQIDVTLPFNDLIGRNKIEIELLDLANELDVEHLAERCVLLIQIKITVENVFYLFYCVEQMMKSTKMRSILNKLMNYCVVFYGNNKPELKHPLK